MKIEKWAAIAEIASRVAVLATLIILILTVFRTCASACYSPEFGQIGEREWGRFEKYIRNRYDNARTFGQEPLPDDVATDEFATYVRTRCSHRTG